MSLINRRRSPRNLPIKDPGPNHVTECPVEATVAPPAGQIAIPAPQPDFQAPSDSADSAKSAAPRPTELQVQIPAADSAPSDSGAVSGGRKRKRKHRKRHNKRANRLLSPEERDQLESEKTAKERFVRGKPMAPFNTTSYLLNDREKRISDADPDCSHSSGGGGQPSFTTKEGRDRTSSGTYMDGELLSETASLPGQLGGDGGTRRQATISDSSDSFDQEFEEEYELVSTERLEAMNKRQLVEECLQKERDLERTTEDLRHYKQEVIQLRKKIFERGR